jgi:hypothetical protein
MKINLKSRKYWSMKLRKKMRRMKGKKRGKWKKKIKKFANSGTRFTVYIKKLKLKNKINAASLVVLLIKF